MKPARGTALRQCMERIRFASGARPGPKPDGKLGPRIVEVRRLLRSSMSIADIASDLNVSRVTLTNFIRRRRICDIADRNRFISLQASLSRIGEDA